MNNKFHFQRQKLYECYGVNFPDSIFWVGDFLKQYPYEQLNEDLRCLGIFPSGVLKILFEFDLSSLNWTAPSLLHYRYYNDLPEFFTCLHGDSDGLHWVILLDEPNTNF